MGETSKELFQLKWTSGSLEINITEFFLASNKNALKKFFKLVMKGENGESADLLNRLRIRIKSCDDILIPLAELRKQSEKLLSDYFGRKEKLPLSPQEKTITKMRDKYTYGVEILAEGRREK